MPKFGPVSRKDLIRAFRNLGFTGPFAGAKHELMVRGDTKAILPNPHGGDIEIGLLKRILRESGVSREEWENA